MDLVISDLSLSLSLSSPTSIATIHQSSSGPNWRLRGRSLLRVPGDGRSQAEGQLEQEGQEGQLAAHRGESVHHAGVSVPAVWHCCSLHTVEEDFIGGFLSHI